MRVNSVQEGLDLLNTDRRVMFAFIPLRRDAFLEAFTANIREREICNFFSGIFNDSTAPVLREIFPQECSPFTLADSKRPGEHLVVPSSAARFNDISNQPVPLVVTLPGLYIHKIATQSDNRRSISRNWHRDTDVLTVNIYGEGDPLRYRVGDTPIHIKAPAIFMHRGVKHPFGLDAAVEHQGREQKGPRANVAYEYDYDEPSINVDVYNY